MDYGQPVRFGVFVIPEATERPLRYAAVADELGFDVVGVQDHPYQRRFFDTWTLLTAIAMRTARITVFPDVANVPLRPPADPATDNPPADPTPPAHCAKRRSRGGVPKFEDT